MQNLKINSTSTPYWCVVVPVDAETPYIEKKKDGRFFIYYWRGDGGLQRSELIFTEKQSTECSWIVLGCITSSGMDEGVREIDTMLAEHWAGICSHWKVNIMKLLTHNQITLTAENKAVVIKQKL